MQKQQKHETIPSFLFQTQNLSLLSQEEINDLLIKMTLRKSYLKSMLQPYEKKTASQI